MKKSEIIKKIYDSVPQDIRGLESLIFHVLTKAEEFGMMPPNKPCGVKFYSGAECTCGSNEWEPEE